MKIKYKERNKLYNRYKHVSSKIEDIIAKEEDTNKLGVNLILHCVEELNPKQIDLLDEMLLTFKHELDIEVLSSGLSIIFMDYLSYGLTTYKGIYDAHSKLFNDWKPNKVEEWVISKLSKIKYKEGIMKIINGNILDMTDGIIVHQVNCKGIMGAGLALQIKNKWPIVFKEYTEHIKYRWERFNQHPLGTINGTSVDKSLMVYNFYSQDNYGRNGRQTNYEAFEKCLIGLVKRFENSKVPIGGIPVYFPYGIGCGLAGGDWKVISELIEKYFPQAIIVKFG